MKKSVRRQNRSPGPILAAKSGPPLPISVPHENVNPQQCKVASHVPACSVELLV